MNSYMTAAAVFEELRFVWELLAAELIFLFPFARARKHVAGKIGISAAVLGICSQFYFFVLAFSGKVPAVLQRWVIVAWYLLLVLMSLVFIRYCFVLTLTDAVYIVITGYAVQHVVYVIVHEVLAKGIWTGVTAHLWLYILISVGVCTLWYGLIYFSFHQTLGQCGGKISDDQAKGLLRQMFALIVLLVSTFTCQHLFESSPELRYYGTLIDFLICTLILANQYSMCRLSLETRENVFMAQMQRESAKFYSFSKELIETVNRKSHDMKHVLNALERADGHEKQAFIEETRKEIDAYRQTVITSNETLNTILAGKVMYCDTKGIRMECSVGDVPENLMETRDMYVLLGNAVDNAIEAVMKVSDRAKRVIHLSVGCQGAFISIQINNYYEGTLKMINGLPATSKHKKYYHGFGLKSIRTTALKYGGDMSIDTENSIFTLQIMIPLAQKNQ